MKRSHNPVRYLPWFIRDAALWPFRWMAFALAVFTFIVSRFVGNVYAAAAAAGTSLTSADAALAMQIAVWTTCLTVAILLALGGIVGTDFERGYYRAYFSKPMSPVSFYLQRWCVAAVVVLLCPLVLGIGMMLVFQGHSGISAELISQIAMAFLLVGSATLLMGNFTSRAWLIVFLVSFLQHALGTVVRPGQVGVPAWVAVMHQVLPPFHLLRPGAPLPAGGDLRLVLLYGAGMFALAIAVLRTRQLSNANA